jgi:hypothetical protein
MYHQLWLNVWASKCVRDFYDHPQRLRPLEEQPVLLHRCVAESLEMIKCVKNPDKTSRRRQPKSIRSDLLRQNRREVFGSAELAI